jgi:exodeoxyribonuclease VII large subunit
MVLSNQSFIKSLSVSELNRYLRQLIESDEILFDVWVQGELSNISKPASGHIYFTLKDSKASLKCVIWRSKTHKINIEIKEGMAVEVHGGITVYEAGGQYQLNADSVRLRGEGDLYKEFLRLKNLLEMEGIFKSENKKPIPETVKKVGIVTSSTGAALQDMIETIQRRNPMMEIVLSGSSVQGESAPEQIVNALMKLQKIDSLDIILIARGGGSIEDLWAFNDERVVRAIANCKIPTITGIGHETDFTLADFVADLRAPTPTAAAELATAVTLTDLLAQLEYQDESLDVFINDLIDQNNLNLGTNHQRLLDYSPIRLIRNYWQNLDAIDDRLGKIQYKNIIMENFRIDNFLKRLSALNPVEVMKRGYAIVTTKVNLTMVSSIKNVSIGEELIVRVQDGKFDVNVSSME